MRHFAAFALSLLCLSTASAQAPTDAQLQELMTLTGMREVMQASLDQGLAAFPSGTPTRFIELFKEEVKLDSLILPAMQLYRERFTSKEVAELIQFYKTSLGQKLIRVQPELVVAGQKNGQVLGERAAQRALKRFQAEQETLLKKDD